MNKFLIILNGPMCSGKSTVTELLMKRDDVFKGSFDAIKWQFSNYKGENYPHKDVIVNMVFEMVETALSSGLSVVIDGGYSKLSEKYKILAENLGVTFLSLNIEAPLDVLQERFLARVESAKQANSKTISVTTVEGFKSRYDKYMNEYKDAHGINFDSSKMSPEEMVSEIDKLL